ncbi:MAG TPA: ASPIC/UnbV domain-containing protein, partial [Rhodothermales bacterium]|nr:ASPIC/UnbV domain-containing protein [Rhodothermales bacterium]
TGSSYLSQSEKVVTFGLGEHEEVDTLVVEWPSGLVERFEGVQGNEEVLLVEGTGRLEPVPMAATAAEGELASTK